MAHPAEERFLLLLLCPRGLVLTEYILAVLQGVPGPCVTKESKIKVNVTAIKCRSA